MAFCGRFGVCGVELFVVCWKLLSINEFLQTFSSHGALYETWTVRNIGSNILDGGGTGRYKKNKSVDVNLKIWLQNSKTQSIEKVMEKGINEFEKKGPEIIYINKLQQQETDNNQTWRLVFI